MDEVCLKLNNSPRRHFLTIPARLLGEDCSLQGCGAVSAGKNLASISVKQTTSIFRVPEDGGSLFR